MKMKYLILTLFSWCAFSQVSVEGVVQDKKTKTPLEEVRIQLRPISKKGAGYWTGTMTKKNGKYKVSTTMSLPATISYQKEGCGKKSIKIKDGDEVPSVVVLDCSEKAIKAIIIEQTLDTDGDGLVDKDDKCPKEAGLPKNEGCPVEESKNSSENDAEPIIEVETDVKAEKENSSIPPPPPPTLIYFNVNDSKLILSYRNNNRIKVIANYLKLSPSAKISVEGHASSDGSSDLNMNLSSNRASMIKKALIDMGVNESSITTKSYGEDKPVESNSTAQGRNNNRRVELIIK
ncbi:MAG: hypothetical protein CMC04_02715 [Flavobacteriaceae bacterium]|nr:hypothetical protein [Flavobacteriaceae bacterium]